MKGARINTAAQVLATLRKLVRRDKAVFLPKFFQAIPVGYGEGDQFLGVVVPDPKKTPKQFRNLPLGEIQQHVHHMPRTMLRYAIEKRAPAERKFWLNIR